MEKDNPLHRQLILYFSFAGLMIILNYLIQKSNQLFFYSLICQNLGSIPFIAKFYCSLNPYNFPELVGSIIAVGVTYLVKFNLDKFIVFKKTERNLRKTSKEFTKYFFFAILTTIENVGIQFLMTNFLKTILEISFVVALSLGYMTKFFLDRRYVFFCRKR